MTMSTGIIDMNPELRIIRMEPPSLLRSLPSSHDKFWGRDCSGRHLRLIPTESFRSLSGFGVQESRVQDIGFRVPGSRAYKRVSVS